MMRKCLFAIILLLATMTPSGAYPFPSNGDAIARMMDTLAGLPAGDRIAAWAESFVGTPYDRDPLGEYVSTSRIVADERVDCMYHAFRSVELGLSNSVESATDKALDMRFMTRGKLGPKGEVLNYDERYQYGMDMIRSGKWGRVITAELGSTVRIRGERGVEFVDIIPPAAVSESLGNLKSGDLVFFIKKPNKRVVGEIVGHIGIIKTEGDVVYVIHASGRKKVGGRVVKVLLADYAAQMPFAGIIVTRF